MFNEKMRKVRDFIVKHSKIVFPIIVIAAVAATVSLALNASNAEQNSVLSEESTSTVESVEVVMEPVKEEVPLLLNEDEAINSLVQSYYNAMALGDSETLTAICDEISQKDMLRYVETSKYISSYPMLEVYTKPGNEEGATIAYVYYKVMFEGQEAEYPGYQAHYICTNEQGELYFKRGENSEEVNEYIKTVSAQADVVEFNNRITVEYNELMAAQPELLEYLSQLDAQVSTAVGESLAQLAAAEQAAQEQENQVSEGDVSGGEAQNGEGVGEAAQNTEQYATATTTVNVRSSDSEQAEKLGKVTGGSKIKVLEQRLNGWTKVLYEKKEGYIKSEFLQMIESADGVASVGSVTATTNINVRSAASETAERLGVLAGGETVELISTEDGWCKIKYNGQIGYVKAEYVQ